MEEPVYTIEQQARLAKTARRRVGSEATLVFAAGGSLLFVLLFVLGPFVLVPAAGLTGIGLTTIGLLIAFGTSAFLALIHVRRLGPKVRRAQELDSEIKYSFARRQKTERDAKIAELRAKKDQ
ncbi:hypothetical protein So717_00130 [Roseobacter cerasinus]|uniref:Uncharacterized protein n=1 Tax=Roseobacter cerasinus TaxID=2602289 RepID=A0A640VLJ1_9RHOB|nr:hypothetical protein [Roseobacter cerasinus]GFE48260.1 hypothetical protein So717_00130 [Roseobacter cerasinus]